jgi:hypothetical protein
MAIFKGSAFCFTAVAAWLASGLAIDAQTLGNQSLKSNYFFRYVSMVANATGSIGDARSIQGSITFDGAGSYTFTGQQVTGVAASVAASGTGTYSVDPAGVVSLTSPLRAGDFVNARLGPEALIGSGTENTDSAFDLFVAIPAAASSGAFSGPYSAVTMEFPGGSTANAINTIFNLRISLPGAFFPVSVYGHTPGLASGSPTTQVISNAAYVFAGSGSGTLTFGSSASLLSGSKTVYVSADGNVIIGGSTAAGAHDFLIGVTTLANPTAASWNGNSWTAGLRFESAAQPNWVSHTGSLSAQGAGSISFYRRLDQLGASALDFTASATSALNPNGLLSFELAQVALGVNGMFVASAIDPSDPGAFEIYFGAPWTPLSGSGVFLNPLGVVNAASFAPAGNPISPGEFITLYGSGLADSTQVAKPPYPATLNNVTVTINGTKRRSTMSAPPRSIAWSRTASPETPPASS